FGAIAKAEDHFLSDNRDMGTEYQDHTREGVRTGYYKETEESSNYGCRTELIFPAEREDRTDRDVFGLYRNRETLHEDEDALDRGEAFFNAVFNDRRNRMTIPYGKIQEDLGIRRGVEDIIYIDGMEAREYVKKYSPEDAGDPRYVKAQIMAALTSGRHRVDMLFLRTDSTGHFKATATEVTMDLSRLNGMEHPWESSRETRRKGLIKDEDARIERQNAIEQAILARANAAADRKTEELIAADQVRSEVFREIPYRELYNKTPKEVEERLDREVRAREAARLKNVFREREKAIFDRAREAIKKEEQAPDAPAENGRRRSRISLEALAPELSKKKPAAAGNVELRPLELKLNVPGARQDEAGAQGQVRNPAPGHHPGQK
ncbi:MAG: hypothetical protein K6E83_08690, partial [Clostridium sp.]|nr:hypothetical protein [Clostridium sp.]